MPTKLGLEGFTEVSEMLGSGVYALAKEGTVVYVGQSKKLITRVSAHRSNWGKKNSVSFQLPASVRGILFDQVFIRPCHVDKLDALEAEMINLYKPRLNICVITRDPIASTFNVQINGMSVQINRPREPLHRRI